jgi:hypothetical protein
MISAGPPVASALHRKIFVENERKKGGAHPESIHPSTHVFISLFQVARVSMDFVFCFFCFFISLIDDDRLSVWSDSSRKLNGVSPSRFFGRRLRSTVCTRVS